MCIADFLATIGYMLAQKREYTVVAQKFPAIDSNQCQFQAFLLTSFEPSVFAFSAILSYYIKESVDSIDSGNKKITMKRRIIHGLIGFLAPFGIFRLKELANESLDLSFFFLLFLYSTMLY